MNGIYDNEYTTKFDAVTKIDAEMKFDGVINFGAHITRRAAAKKIYEVLHDILKEPDVDWKAAEIIKDLYDCHTCVMSIAQTYVKGIMELSDGNLFNGEAFLTDREMKDIIERLYNKDKRLSVETRILSPGTGSEEMGKLPNIEASRMFPQKFAEIIKEYIKNGAVLVDVRAASDYEKGHIGDSMNIPLHKLYLNPYILESSKERMILLYCENGSMSREAQNILLSSGYINVYTIPGLRQYNYDLTL